MLKNIKNFIKNSEENKKNNLKIINSSFYDSIISTKVIEGINKSLKNKGKVIQIK